MASRLFFLITAVSLMGSVIPASAQSRKSTRKEESTIYVIRGGGGYFPNLGTVINQKFEAKGLRVVDFRFHERMNAADQIAKAYRAKELPHGVILVGYSLGGVGVIDVSNVLKEQNIPVRLLFLIETINPLQTVPSNVQECFNLYHFPAILGAPVKADSPNTKLTNFEAYRDGKMGLEYSHFAMPFVEEVHELIASKLITAINSKAPKATTTLAKTSRSSSTQKGGTKATEEAKPGPFAALFGNPVNKDEKEATAPAKKATMASTVKKPAGKTEQSTEEAKPGPFAALFGNPVNKEEKETTAPAKKATTASTTKKPTGKTEQTTEEAKPGPFAALFGSNSQKEVKEATPAPKKSNAPIKKEVAASEQIMPKQQPFAALFGKSSQTTDVVVSKKQ